ncbi:MAG: hypothetical protein JSR77_11970 [Planctomycetes bacterium]|nr:hypothetical protein [Planctomycetota bacterium]
MEPATERGRRLAALSAQLRELHAALADESADMRQEQLRDRVQRELSSLPAHEREPFLSDLMTQFPVWNEGNNGSVQHAPAPAAAKPTDPRALADMLIEACASLPETARNDIAGRLAAAGLGISGGGQVREVVKEVIKEVRVPTGPGGLPAAALGELRRMVGLPADTEIQGDRLVDLCTLLSEFVLKLEPWACTYWRELGPDAKNPVPRSLDKGLAKFVSGDPSASKDAVARDILKLRSLVSLLLKGVLDSGKQFGKDHMARFSVDAVQSAAERGTFTESQGAKNWKQYVRLMEGYDAAAMEKRLKSLIAKDVDNGLSQVIR